MNTKAWYLSKILWVNTIAVLALLLQTRFGFVIDPEAQTGLLAVVNLALRAITRQPLEWKPSGPDDGNTELPHFIPPTGTAGFMRLRLLFAGLLILSAMMLMCTGCASTPSTSQPPTATASDSPQVLAGKSLLAVKSTIVTAATATDALCKAGKIPADICSQAKTAYELAQPAYDAAVDSYLLMTSGGGDPGDFGRKLTTIQSLAANLLEFSRGVK